MLMMTNRPDKLDADLKRPGRFDLKIPFFFPETGKARTSILEALQRKNRIVLADGVDLAEVSQQTVGYSGAELEAVLLAAVGVANDEERDVIGEEDLRQATRDVIPSRDTRMLAYMEMLAVFESSSRRMLPERYRELDTAEVQKELDSLRAQLGRRVEY
jgi:ATP-dependent 26S proteasome regulatory subunit